jgi:hypothetical protein
VVSVTPTLAKHSDDRADNHGDREERVVGQRHFGRLGGGQLGAVRLDLPGVREMHEQPLGREDNRDGQDGLHGYAEPVEAGVGTGDAVDPPIPGPDRVVGGGRHSVPTISASRASMACARSTKSASARLSSK